MAQYREPGWLVTRVVNPGVSFLVRLGIGLLGVRLLAVRGRTSGRLRVTPVAPLTFEGRRYMVAPRGPTEWVRNIRAAGQGELRLGRAREHIRVLELSDDLKPPILRAYLKRWRWRVGRLFGDIGVDASHDELMTIAPEHPVFRIDEE